MKTKYRLMTLISVMLIGFCGNAAARGTSCFSSFTDFKDCAGNAVSGNVKKLVIAAGGPLMHYYVMTQMLGKHLDNSKLESSKAFIMFLLMLLNTHENKSYSRWPSLLDLNPRLVQDEMNLYFGLFTVSDLLSLMEIEWFQSPLELWFAKQAVAYIMSDMH